MRYIPRRKPLKTRFISFWQEVWRELCIWFWSGAEEWLLYRSERNQTGDIIWAPSKGCWVRARIIFRGFRYNRIEFVDGKKAKGKRSPLSVRPRDPRKRGADKPYVDARHSGNRPTIGTIADRLYDAAVAGKKAMDELAATFRVQAGG